MLRPFALTMPAVTVLSRLNGLPTASTHSPTRMESLLPNTTKGRRVSSILSSAMSVLGSEPTNFALYSRLSAIVTLMSVLRSTTWWLVTMYPSGDMMTPEPEDPVSEPPPHTLPPVWIRALILTTAGVETSAASIKSVGEEE